MSGRPKLGFGFSGALPLAVILLYTTGLALYSIRFLVTAQVPTISAPRSRRRRSGGGLRDVEAQPARALAAAGSLAAADPDVRGAVDPPRAPVASRHLGARTRDLVLRQNSVRLTSG